LKNLRKDLKKCDEAIAKADEENNFIMHQIAYKARQDVLLEVTPLEALPYLTAKDEVVTTRVVETLQALHRLIQEK